MSSRAFKNAVANQELLDFTAADQEEEEEQFPVRSKGPTNMFAMLNNDEDELEEEEEEEEVEESTQESMVSSPTTPSKKNKPKKKKKKGKKNTGEERETTGGSGSKQERKCVDDQDIDIDAQLREINREFISSDSCMETVEQDLDGASTLLTVQRKYLSAEAEMKRLFGFKTVNDVNDKSQRRGHGRHSNIRRYWLVTPKPNWPRWTHPGVVMQKVESDKPGDSFFTYTHNKAYQNVQYMFLAAVETMDPNHIVGLMNRYPYHIDSLLQLSEISAMQGDHAMSLELIERALFVFESNFHIQFKLGTGNCKIEYRHFENRAFFLALFRYITILGQKGCWRTALEFTKLLLGLDDTDPLCALLLVDFYALRSREYDFLIRLYDLWDPIRHLHLLPNFAYSIALAHFHREQEAAPTEEGIKDANQVLSNQLLQRAMILFPMVLLPLATKADIDLDASVASNPFFEPLESGPNMCDYNRSVLGLTKVYIHRSSSMWKEAQVATWVRMNAAAVIGRVAKGDKEVKECGDSRVAAYSNPGSRSVHRHIILSGIQEAISTLPPSVSRETMRMYDPVPPTNGTTPYNAQQEVASVDTQTAINMFLRSLLPSFGVEDGVELANQVERAGVDVAELMGGFNLATLREVLTNAVGAGEDVDGNSDSDSHGNQ